MKIFFYSVVFCYYYYILKKSAQILNVFNFFKKFSTTRKADITAQSKRVIHTIIGRDTYFNKEKKNWFLTIQMQVYGCHLAVPGVVKCSSVRFVQTAVNLLQYNSPNWVSMHACSNGLAMRWITSAGHTSLSRIGWQTSGTCEGNKTTHTYAPKRGPLSVIKVFHGQLKQLDFPPQ